MILVDTSIWIDHLRRNDEELVALLNAATVLIHPFIIGEIALGNLKQRQLVLESLSDLPQAQSVTDAEALAFIELSRLAGTGIGYLDTHLLASAKLSHAKLWTRDKKLAALATSLHLAFVTS